VPSRPRRRRGYIEPLPSGSFRAVVYAGTDPDEIVNRAGTEPALEQALAHRLSQLRRCAGSGCRLAENHPIGDTSGREA